ncbi:MAG: DUF3365 domain-containing protein [Bacteroidia bacterium]|nr:DUF3365 domain-containing protein [Bacteroidia bacterium]MDW8134676.1 DUF3365 domain-containing protein [Bacteroidia bacterium]
MRRIWRVGGIGIALFSSCQSPPVKDTSAPASLSTPTHLNSLKELGDSLTLSRQRSILQNLLQRAQREGWAGAVRYCHLAAETLTFYKDNRLSLQRVALRFRNPKNSLQDSLDRLVYSYYDTTASRESYIVQLPNGNVRYYRPIYIMMEECLKCHGMPSKLDGPALAQIRKRYLGDKATGFNMGDLRGMWKIEFYH